VLLVGCSQAVLDDIAAVRPAASVLVLPRINDKSDVAAMVLHRRTFRMLEPDLFHFNLSEGSSCQYAMAAALTVRGAKVIATENSPKGVRSDLSRRIKAMTAPRLAAHVAVGEAAARLVERDIGLAEGSVSVIPNGVPPIEHHPGPRVAAGLVVGALSRFDPVKGLDVLIDAVPLIEGATVEIIGDGPLRGELEAQIADLGVVERVDLRGWIDGARHELPNFDVFVLPSRLEGMPMSVIEAMQAGVAVVATDVGSVGEVVEDGVTGRVVVPGDPVALADAINELLADSALRQRLASAGQKVALERFSSAANVAAYERLYDEVLGRR
jgi:glycosyltransferase involved in cell wall biosynthesis